MGADDARKLFVGGLSDSITEDILRDIFEGSGQVVADVHVPRDRESGRPRGFAFVTFATPDAAELARQAVDGAVHGGRPISVRRFSQEGPRRTASDRPPRADDRTVFVGKLPYDASIEEVEALFVSHDLGPVARVSLPTGPDGRPRGFGFVTLDSAEAATAAVDRLSRAQLRGRSLVVTPAQPRGKAGPGGREPGEAPRSDMGRPAPRFGGPPRAPRFDDVRHEARDEGGIEEDFDASPDSLPPLAAGEEGPRRDDKKRKKDKKKRAPEKSPRRERGGASTWHRWERDDD
jgi:RNA recognition motif-containing protein